MWSRAQNRFAPFANSTGYGQIGISKVSLMREQFLVLAALGLGALWTSESLASMPGEGTRPQDWTVDDKAMLPAATIYDAGPSRWSLGLYGGDERRDVVSDAPSRTVGLDIIHLWAFAGFDAFRWLTLQVAAGAGQPSSSSEKGSMDAGVEWAAGVRWRIMDYLFDTEDPFRCHFDADAQYNQGTSDSVTGEADWDEWSGSLTIAFVSCPQTPAMMMRSVGFYAGVGFSYLNGSGAPFADNVSYKGERNFGLIGGLIWNPSDYVFLKGEVQSFEEFGGSLSVGLHF